MNQIYKNLYQYSMHIQPMHFTIHQYLLDCEAPTLVSTGTMQQAELILPEIKKILNGRNLQYILVSHMESDECGGLTVFQKEYPEAITICSELCARELSGFGYIGKILVQKQGDKLEDKGISLKFIAYPAEVHLQDGLVFYEKNRRIFFSGDLMLRFGDAVGKTIDGQWKDEVYAIDLERVPNEKKLSTLKNTLFQLKPYFIAVGHGFCVNCK